MPDTLTLAGGRNPAPRLAASTPTTLELTGRSAAITRVQELVRRAAPLDAGVLLTAEPGADVDSVARELHVRSRRGAGPFVAVECGGADPVRIGQLLFGSPVAAAGTGGDLDRIARDSRVAAARGGTLFLQNIVE